MEGNRELLRPLWRRLVGRAWVLSAILFVVLGCVRGYGAYGPEEARSWLMIGFFSMWFLPGIFFSRAGRRAMGLKQADRPGWLLWGPLLGATSACLVFALGFWLYGRSELNWFVAIGNQFLAGSEALGLPQAALMVVYTVPAILFSPVGEELFFRGMIHESVGERWGERLATLANGLAFGTIHLFHYGITRDASGYHFLLVPGLAWILLMMGLSWIFGLCRRRSGSIWPAVLAHAAFNLVMNLTVFLILR